MTPKKEMYCQRCDLDLDEFLASRELKEKHRIKMTKYYLSIRPDYLSRELLDSLKCKEDYCIISDLRRFLDLKYLYRNTSKSHRHLIIRLDASKEIRKARGWQESSYDDSAVECEFDD